MNKKIFTLALMASAATLCAATPAFAQEPPATAGAPGDAPEDEASSQVVAEPAPSAEESAAKAAFLEAQVNSLQEQIDALKTQLTKATPTWKGAPQWDDKESGFSFKPKGFAQFDAGYVGFPGEERNGTIGGLNYNNLGWNMRARRLVFGAEGSLPGGFGYKAEFNFAQGTVDYEDIVLTYQQSGKPFQITVGNFYPLSSLETMTSSRLGSFLERASFTDAFAYNRRLGLAVGLVDPADRYTLTAGVWGGEINNSTSFNRTGWQASIRGTYTPQFAGGKLHLGANFQHRVTQRDAQNVQYRTRPFTQITDQRLVDTGLIAADGDDIAGLELGGIFKSFHFAAEAQKVWVRGYRPGKVLGDNNSVASGLFYAGDPSFFAGYAEVGYYFTGESRGYKGGKWDRTKVLHPFDQGGWGALQLNLRFDYTDLSDRLAAGSLAAPNYVNGGKQVGYQASLIWNPMDYIRFMAQYAHGEYTGGPRASAVKPLSTDPVNERDFSNDSFALRAQVEF